MEDRISTRLAEMVLADRVIEVHYRPGADLDVDGLMEVQSRRKELTTDRCGMIAFFQPGTLGDMRVLETDFFKLTNANEQLIALAIVCQDQFGDAMSSIYYSYHPQTFPTRIFLSEAEARKWMKERLAEEDRGRST